MTREDACAESSICVFLYIDSRFGLLQLVAAVLNVGAWRVYRTFRFGELHLPPFLLLVLAGSAHTLLSRCCPVCFELVGIRGDVVLHGIRLMVAIPLAWPHPCRRGEVSSHVVEMIVLPLVLEGCPCTS